MTKPKSRAELNNPQGGGGEERKKVNTVNA